MIDQKADAKAIFLQALDCKSNDELERFIDRECGADPALRSRVEELLRAHRDAGAFLRGVDWIGATTDPPHIDRPGAVIGPYKLLEQIGEGGFGVVFLAEQSQPVRRKVALKVLKPGMDTRQVVARFEAERQALAIMDHPNIAKVFDGGVTPTGLPYFVMELVKGVPITEFCDTHQLNPRQRLELFVSVCQAVQHAHQKGIIHRDLKPTNVLVSRHDTTPVPKIIDFGVAKALGQVLTDKTMFTGVAQMVGTPLYMSPEQAGMSDLDVDTRSDIYSLGVLLYELLTGTTPFAKERMKTASYDELRRMIREEEPPKPSTRLAHSAETLVSISAQRQTEPAKLTGLMRGELDWIVMKALEKDRNRRYETANSFAMDVQRYLCGEAVQAVPPSAGYRLRKFARRNRRTLVTGAALAFALMLTIGAVAGTVGWAARDRADRRAAVEQEARRALDEAQQWREQEQWSQALASVKRGQGLLAGGGSDELRDHVQQLRRDLEMVLRLEDIGILTADAKNDRLDWDVVDPGYAKAFAHYGVMDQGYADAFAEYGIDVLNLPVEEAAARIQVRDWLAIPLSVALDDWASTPSLRNESDRAKIRAVANAVDPDPWRRQVREAVEKRDGRALTDLAGSPNLAQQSRNSIVVLKHGLRFHGLKEKSLEVLRMLQRQYPGDFWLNYWLADELNVFPDSDRDEAISFARAAVAIRPKSAAAHLLLANSLQNKGKFDEAYIYNRNAIELAPNYAYAHNDFGWTLFRLGKVDDAIACYHKAIELNPKYALAYINLGVALVTLKKLTDGIAAFRRSIEIYPKYDVAYSNLGNALWRQGKLDEASDCFDKAVELVPNNAYARQTAARAFALTGQWDKAVVHTGKVIEMRPSDDNWWMIHATFVLRSGDVEAYRQVCNAMIEKFRQTKEPIVAHRLACTCLLIPDAVSDAKLPQKLAEFSAAGAHGIPWADITMGLAHYRAGQFEQAIERLKPYSGQPEFEIGTSFFIAMSHQRLDQRGEARQWFDKAVRIMDQEMAAKEIGRHRVDSQSWAANQVIRVEAEELFKK